MQPVGLRETAQRKVFFVKLKVKLSLISCNVDTVYDQAYCYIDCDILHKMGASFGSHVRKDIFPWMIFEKKKKASTKDQKARRG